MAYKQFVGIRGFGNSWLFTLILLPFAGFLVFPLYFFFQAFEIPVLVQLVLVVAIIISSIVGLRFAIASYNKSRARLFKFAERNNLSFIQNRPDPAYAGMIFDEGNSRVIDNAFVFPGRAEIGNYTYVTGSGKNRTSHAWAYVKVKLPRRLPNMVLDAKKNNIFGRFSNLPDTFDKNQTLALEGDFNEHFTLYAPKQYEPDALYVFTPDVMARLIDSGSSYDMEVIDDELFMYKSGRINLASETDLKAVLAIVDAIGKDLREQTDYYADERVGDRTRNIVAPQGARLKHGINWAVVVIIIAIVFFQLVEWFGN